MCTTRIRSIDSRLGLYSIAYLLAALAWRHGSCQAASVSDERIRRFERLARGGDVAAMGQLLLERLRLGYLSRDRLELAAHLNDPAALAALGVDPSGEPADLREWTCALQRWGRPTVVRALVAAGRTLQPSRAPAANEALLEVARTWAECPCTPHAQEAYEACGHAEQGNPFESSASSVAFHVAHATYVAGFNQGPAGGTSLQSMVAIVLRVLREGGRSPDEVRRAVQRELAEWALQARAPGTDDAGAPCEPVW